MPLHLSKASREFQTQDFNVIDRWAFVADRNRYGLDVSFPPVTGD
ncbi:MULTISPECIES: hypothetical protein [unclassified Shewanella]|nr:MULTISPECIES: hypothetical protein [unclassified Shewanella]